MQEQTKAWLIKCRMLPNTEFRLRIFYMGKQIGTLYKKFWEANEFEDALKDDPNFEFVTDLDPA